jgi:transmembrane sensor
MRYSDFSVSDFTMDEYFQSWVFNPADEGIKSFWESWLLNHPEKRRDVGEARKLLEMIQFTNHTLSADELASLWSQIHRVDVPLKHRGVRQFSWAYRVAAAIGLISVISLIYFWSGNEPWKEYRTAYGETKNILLPDGSSVVLNANSRLTLLSDWTDESSREIWLDGEAFFSVVHKANNQPFKVSTAEGVTVEVLGTTFNVYNRTNGTKVVLNSGQIRLNLPTAKSPETILMKPGEMVEFKEQHFEKKEVDPQLYSAWTNSKIILDHTSLAEMVYMLHDSYGLDVRVSNSELLKETVSGSMPLGDAEILLQQMAKAFQLEIKKDGNTIMMEEMKQ